MFPVMVLPVIVMAAFRISERPPPAVTLPPTCPPLRVIVDSKPLFANADTLPSMMTLLDTIVRWLPPQYRRRGRRLG